MLGNLIGGFITILVGVNLIPTVADSINDARYVNASGGATPDNTLVTGTAGTILGLVTLFFALGVMASGVALAVQGLKNAGLV
jgi:hypothetical protein